MLLCKVNNFRVLKRILLSHNHLADALTLPADYKTFGFRQTYALEVIILYRRACIFHRYVAHTRHRLAVEHQIVDVVAVTTVLRLVTERAEVETGKSVELRPHTAGAVGIFGIFGVVQVDFHMYPAHRLAVMKVVPDLCDVDYVAGTGFEPELRRIISSIGSFEGTPVEGKVTFVWVVHFIPVVEFTGIPADTAPLYALVVDFVATDTDITVITENFIASGIRKNSSCIT